MNLRSIMFAGWCLSLIGGSALSSYYAWSPFADGKRDPLAVNGGPSHK